MTIKEMAITFVLNIVAGILLGALLLGFIGLLVGGTDGLIGGATWGALLGALGGVLALSAISYEGWSRFMKSIGELIYRRR